MFSNEKDRGLHQPDTSKRGSFDVRENPSDAEIPFRLDIKSMKDSAGTVNHIGTSSQEYSKHLGAKGELREEEISDALPPPSHFSYIAQNAKERSVPQSFSESSNIIDPGTETIRKDAAGGGWQEVTWDRYKGERQGNFYIGDRVFDGEWRKSTPAPLAVDVTTRGKTEDRMWTEISKDLVTKEAIEQLGYKFEETDDYIYVIEYLRYVSYRTCHASLAILTCWIGGRACARGTNCGHTRRATRKANNYSKEAR